MAQGTITKAQYDALIKKYGSTRGVIQALSKQGKSQDEINTMAGAMNQFTNSSSSSGGSSSSSGGSSSSSGGSSSSSGNSSSSSGGSSSNKPTKPKPKTITRAQYNSLIKKYGSTRGVIQELSRQGKSQDEINALAGAMNKFTRNTSSSSGATGTPQSTQAQTRIEAPIQTQVQRETTPKIIAPDIKTPNISDLKAFDYKWDSPERQSVAKKYGIDNYTGTYEQNIELKKKISEGTTDKGAETTEVTEDIQPSQEPGSENKGEKLDTNSRMKDSQDSLLKLRLSGLSDKDILDRTEKKFGKDSEEYKKIKDFIDENPEKTGVENLDETFIDKSFEEQTEITIKSLEDSMNNKISTANEQLIRTLETKAENYERMSEFLNNSIDEIGASMKEYQKRAAEDILRVKNRELNRVAGQIRATLAQRGVDIGNIPPEQIIAMSGQLGVEALRVIDEATMDIQNELLAFEQAKQKELQELNKQGVISQNDYELGVEQARQLTEANIQAFKDAYMQNVISIGTNYRTQTDANKSNVINSVNNFATSLGLSGTAMGLMNSYFNANDSTQALAQMITDLNNPNSELYKAVDDVEKAKAAAAEFEAQIELMKATKSSSSGGSSSPKFSALQISALDNIGQTLKVPQLSNVRNIDDYNAILGTLPVDIASQIRNQFDEIRVSQNI